MQKHLNVHEKNTVLQRIKRKTPEEKLTDLLHWTKAIRDYHHWKVNYHYCKVIAYEGKENNYCVNFRNH